MFNEYIIEIENTELISYEKIEGPTIEYSMEEVQIEKYSPNNVE